MAAKYDTSAGIEGEFEPGSNGAVLKNLKGITTKAAMDGAGNPFSGRSAGTLSGPD